MLITAHVCNGILCCCFLLSNLKYGWKGWAVSVEQGWISSPWCDLAVYRGYLRVTSTAHSCTISWQRMLLQTHPAGDILSKWKRSGFLYRSLANKKKKQLLEHCGNIWHQWYQKKVLNQNSDSKLCFFWENSFDAIEGWVQISHLLVQSFTSVSKHPSGCLKSAVWYELVWPL